MMKEMKIIKNTFILINEFNNIYINFIILNINNFNSNFIQYVNINNYSFIFITKFNFKIIQLLYS